MARYSFKASMESLDSTLVEPVVQHVSDTDRVHETVDMLYASSKAATLCDDAQAANRDAEELSTLRDVVESVNSSESWNDATLALVELQQQAIVNRLGIAPFLQLKSQHNRLTKTKLCVSTEDMGQIIESIQNSSASLEERSITALVDLLTALSDTVPKAYSRLNELQHRAADQSDRDSIAPVSLDPRVEQRLRSTGGLESLSSYINSYCKYGSNLLGRYSEVSFQSVMKSALFQQGIDSASYQGFWDAVSDRIRDLRDPRCELTDEQLGMVMPGGRPLFMEKVTADDAEATPTVRDRLRSFIQSYRPVSLSEFAESDQVADGSQLPALRASVIRDCTTYLMDLSKDINLRSVIETCRAAWTDSSRTIRTLRESLRTSDDTLLSALDGDERLVSGYLETHFMLSAWPLLNYLTSVTLFVNAFVDYAVASLEAPDGEGTELVGNDSDKPSGESDDEVEIVDDVDAVDAETDDETGENESTDIDVSPSGWLRDKSDIDVSDTEASEDAESTGIDVPDTGETPDSPQDATGDGERAIVEGVEDTIEKSGEAAAEASTDDTTATPTPEAAPAADADAVDISAPAEPAPTAAPASTEVDVSGGAPQPEDEENKEDTSTNVDVSA